jgi:asparaginyl-tRNA synthetase
MLNTTIKQMYRNTKQYSDKHITVSGWVRTIRDSKAIGFIELNDGSFFKNLQIVFERDVIGNFDEIAKLSSGASVIVEGEMVETPNARQPFELKASKIDIEGTSTPDYPLLPYGSCNHILLLLKEILLPHLQGSLL